MLIKQRKEKHGLLKFQLDLCIISFPCFPSHTHSAISLFKNGKTIVFPVYLYHTVVFFMINLRKVFHYKNKERKKHSEGISSFPSP